MDGSDGSYYQNLQIGQNTSNRTIRHIEARPGTNVVNRIDPPGTQYNMVVSEGQGAALMRGQPVFGGWATSDDVTSQAFARNDLAITDGFKPDVSQVATVETTAPRRSTRERWVPRETCKAGANSYSSSDKEISSWPARLSRCPRSKLHGHHPQFPRTQNRWAHNP